MKHLTYDERLQIQKALTLNCSFTEIANKIGKDRTTIGREVKAYAKYVGKPARRKCKFKCIFEDQAKCPAPNCTKRVCSIACARCAQYGQKYEPQIWKKQTHAIEINTATGETECRMFYCDPQQTNQKSRCERNQEYIRYMLPKGTSFDELTQEEITLVMSHVNSMPRGRLNARAPIQLFMELYGARVATRLGLEFIPLEQLCLKLKLLKK